MKTKQRILSALLVLVMVLAIVPAISPAAKAAALPTITIGSGFAADTVRAINDVDTFINGIPSNATVVKYVSDIGTNAISDGASKYLGCFANTTSNTQKDVVFRATASAGKENTSDNYVFTDPNTRIQINNNTSKNQQEAETGYYYREVNGERWYSHQIRLGGYGTLYTKGLGVNPNTSGTENAIVYNIPEGTTHFYAVVGNCGSNGTNGNVTVQYTVQVRVDSSGTWIPAASVAVTGCQTGEFLVDVSGYGQIRLSQKTTVTYTSGGRYGAWGNASFLNMTDEPEANVAFESALSMLTRWNASAFTTAPSKVYYTFKNTTTSSGVNTQFENYYTGVLNGIAAKEMTEKVSMYLANASGVPVTGKVSNSIREYAIKHMTSNANDIYKTVAGSMLDYGAAVQTYFKYNTGNLANTGAPAYNGLDYADFIGDIQDVRQGSDLFYATNLRLEDEINLMFYFKDLPEGYSVAFTWEGKDGSVTATLQETTAAGIVMAELKELPVKDYAKTVTCTVMDGSGNVVATAQDSVASYSLRAIQKGTSSKAVCIELLEYAEAVVRYMRTKHNYASEVTPPTCTNEGYTTYTCTDKDCSDSYVDDFVPAVGHNWDGTNCSVCSNIPLPAYSGTILNATYHCGNGNYLVAYKWVYSAANTKNYESSLISAGFTLVQENEIGSNRFTTYIKDNIMVHCSYFAKDYEFRITSGTASYLGNTEAVTGYDDVVTPSVSMIALGGDAEAGTALSMVIQLADGSFVIIDGGFGQKTGTDVQNADMERLLNFLTTKTPGGGKPQITWMITHADWDHIALPTSFINKYYEKIDVNTVCYNFADMTNSAIDNASDLTNYYEDFIDAVNGHFPEANHYIMHTGNKLYLPGCEIEFLITAAEDLNLASMTSGNHTSNAWRMTIEGKTILITGDIEEPLSKKMANNYGEYLASNILQVVHHGVNGATKQFNQYVASGTEAEGNNLEVCFWPIRTNRIWRTEEYPTINQPLWNSGAAHYYHDYTTTLLLPSLTEE